MKELILADFSWMCHKFYHAYSWAVVKSEGVEKKVGVLVGFSRFCSICCHPTRKIVFCIDSKEAGRKEEYSGYKEGRQEHSEVYAMCGDVLKVLSLLDGVEFSKMSGKEADDVIAVEFFRSYEKYDRVVVYTADNDMLQLHSKGAFVSNKFDKGDFVETGREYIMEKYGVEPKDLLKYRVIVGDSGDNIPPVVPRLRREFIREFCKAWDFTEASFDTSIIGLAYKYPKEVEKLLLKKEEVFRNKSIMSLLRYEGGSEEPMRFKVTPDPLLVEKYRLYQFKRYLQSVNTI